MVKQEDIFSALIGCAMFPNAPCTLWLFFLNISKLILYHSDIFKWRFTFSVRKNFQSNNCIVSLFFEKFAFASDRRCSLGMKWLNRKIFVE